MLRSTLGFPRGAWVRFLLPPQPFFFFSLIHPIPPCPEPRTTDSKVGWLLLCQLFCGNQVCCEVTTPNCSSAASTVLVRTPIRHSYPAQSCLTFPTSTDSSLPVAWITGPATDPSYLATLTFFCERKIFLSQSILNGFGHS